MSNWNREGQIINGLYLGSFPCCGEVLESRVKYGGMVQHLIKVVGSFELYGTERDRLTLDEDEVAGIA